MIINVPNRVDDPKDAVLWSIFDKLQKIDDEPSTRIAFATGILYNAQFGMTAALFDDELKQLREILKIPEPVISPEAEPQPTTRESFVTEPEDTLRLEI